MCAQASYKLNDGIEVNGVEGWTDEVGEGLREGVRLVAGGGAGLGRAVGGPQNTVGG